MNPFYWAAFGFNVGVGLAYQNWISGGFAVALLLVAAWARNVPDELVHLLK